MDSKNSGFQPERFLSGTGSPGNFGLLSGPEPKHPEFTMIRRYENNLISFAYPANWKLTDSEQDALPREISLESPEGALWVAHAFAPNLDADELMAEAIRSFEENYEDFEYSEYRSELPIPPTRAIQADFFCLDFLVTARIMLYSQTPLTYMVIHQAENRQFEESSLVMDAITASLVSDAPINLSEGE